MVSAIAPGMVRTPMLAGMTAGRISQLAAGYPGGQLPEAEDIAQAIAFAGDPQTMFITGQVLIIDGGRSVGLSGTEPHGDRPHHAAAVRASRLRAPP